MEARAIQRTVRQSARKMRLVIDQIRGRAVPEAYAILRFSKKHAAKQIHKVLKSAVANAEQRAQRQNVPLDVDHLHVRYAVVNEGPTLKRWRPRARGRGTRIRKRTCHVTSVLSRFSDDELDRRRRREAATGPTRRLRRPTRRRRRPREEEFEETEEHDHEHEDELGEDLVDEEAEPEDTGEDVALADVPDVADLDADAQPLGAEPPRKAPAKKKAPATKKPAKKKSTTAKKPTAKKTTAKKPQKTTKKTTKKKKDE